MDFARLWQGIRVSLFQCCSPGAMQHCMYMYAAGTGCHVCTRAHAPYLNQLEGGLVIDRPVDEAFGDRVVESEETDR